MPHCTVPLCTNGSRKTKGTDISYHRLPNGPLRSVWLHNLRLENPRERVNTYVCSTHFAPDCFELNAEVIPGFKKRKTLKPSNEGQQEQNKIVKYETNMKSDKKGLEILVSHTVWYFIY
jgi:hypothetical protein